MLNKQLQHSHDPVFVYRTRRKFHTWWRSFLFFSPLHFCLQFNRGDASRTAIRSIDLTSSWARPVAADALQHQSCENVVAGDSASSQPSRLDGVQRTKPPDWIMNSIWRCLTEISQTIAYFHFVCEPWFLIFSVLMPHIKSSLWPAGISLF